MKDLKDYVLCCIDGSSVTPAVCDYASWIAKAINAPLRVLHTIEHQPTPVISDYSGAIGLGTSEELLNELAEVEKNHSRLQIKRGELMLSATKERIMATGLELVDVRQRHGSLSESLIELEEHIKFLVIGIRGEEHEDSEGGIGRQLETVIRALHKPILVVNKEFKTPQTIMFACDGSDVCKNALRMIASNSLFSDLHCHVVHVGEDGSALLNAAASVLQVSGKSVTIAQLSGQAEDVLAQYQRDNQIDLTVMGAFSHNRFRGFLLGSFTANMLRATRRPLLLLR